MKSTGPLNKIASATIKECLPKGQARAAAAQRPARTSLS